MNLVEAVRFTRQSLRSNKMRAGLTMLGMVIGTASIILVVTIALSSREYILRQIQGVGANLIYLYHESDVTEGGANALADELTMGDLEAIRELPMIAEATGYLTKRDRIMVNGREREISVIGTTPEYVRVRNLRMISGRFFDVADDRSFDKVCLVTRQLARRLWGTPFVRGEEIKIFQVRFEVIGVFEEGTETFGASEISTETALIPLSVMRQFTMTDQIEQIYASARSIEIVPFATERIRSLVESRHRPGATYRVENLAEILKAAGRIATVLTVVLFLIGTISLVISGIGIMNIMLVTVTERTKEIGLKMAVGARRREILFQFLAESLFMSTVGGGLGILLGVSGPLAVRWVSGFDIPVSLLSIVLAFALSLAVGVTFGLLPANRAAKLNPSEALHYE